MVLGEKERLAEEVYRLTAIIEELRLKATDLSEINRLKLIIDEKERIISELKATIDSLAFDKNRIAELKEKLSHMMIENERVNDHLSQVTHDMAGLDARFQACLRERDRLRALLAEKPMEVEVVREVPIEVVRTKVEKNTAIERELRNKITQLNSEIDELRREIEEYEAKMSRFIDLEAKLRAVTLERDRLKAKLAEKPREVEVIKEVEVVKTKVEKNTALENELRNKLARANSEIEELHREIEALKLKLSKYVDLEGKLRLVTGERDRLTHQVDELLREIETYKARIAKLESENKVIADLRSKLSRALHQIEELKEEIEELRNKKPKTIVKTRPPQIKEVIVEKFIEAEPQIKTTVVHMDMKERDALERIIAEKDRLLHELSLPKPVETYAHLLPEIERLKSILSERDLELRSAHQERDRLTRLVEERLREIEHLRARLTEAGRDASLSMELERRISHLEGENGRLNASLMEKKAIIEDWQAKFRALESHHMHLKHTSRRLEETLVEEDLARPRTLISGDMYPRKTVVEKIVTSPYSPAGRTVASIGASPMGYPKVSRKFF